jgi:hypothetical protein
VTDRNRSIHPDHRPGIRTRRIQISGENIVFGLPLACHGDFSPLKIRVSGTPHRIRRVGKVGVLGRDCGHWHGMGQLSVFGTTANEAFVMEMEESGHRQVLFKPEILMRIPGFLA